MTVSAQGPGFRPVVQLDSGCRNWSCGFFVGPLLLPATEEEEGGGCTVGWAMFISTHKLVLWPQEVQEAVVFSSGCWHGPPAAIDIDMICCSHLMMMITLSFSYENMDGKRNVPWIHHQLTALFDGASDIFSNFRFVTKVWCPHQYSRTVTLRRWKRRLRYEQGHHNCGVCLLGLVNS